MVLKIAQFGLGPIGIETLKALAVHKWARIVGAIDNDPAKAGKDLADFPGIQSLRQRRVYPSLGELLTHEKPDIIVHTAVSRFNQAFEQLEPMAKAGISVVSSCEELVFPQLKEPRLARRLNRLCVASGSRIVGTGVNPGFVMDVLPLCLTGVSLEARSIRIERVVDASTRREPLQRKIGSGQPTREFARKLKQGLAGHAGLRESLALIAHCLGWPLSEISETAKPVVAERDIVTKFFKVRQGETCGIHQLALGKIDRRVRLELDIKMYLDAPNPHDSIWIEGEPPLQMNIAGGVAGDQATVAALVNTARRVLDAPPGLRLMPDLSLPRLAR